MRAARAAAGDAPPAHRFAADLLLERLAHRTPTDLDARIARLSGAEPSGAIEAAVLTLEADSVAAAMLGRAAVPNADGLPAITRGTYDAVMASADRWAVQAGGMPDSVGNAPAPTPAAVAGPAATSAAPNISGPATGPSPWAPPTVQEEIHPSIFTIDVGVSGALYLDDAPNADTVGGAEFGLSAHGRLAISRYVYFRTALVFGFEAGFGSWRDHASVIFLAATGLRFEVGPRETGVFVQVLWTPGYAFAEARESGTPLAYHAGIGMTFGMWEVGVEWREVGREAYDTARSLHLTLSAELFQ